MFDSIRKNRITLYGVEIYFTIKTLLSRGKSPKSISQELEIHRNTAKKIKEKIETGPPVPPIQKRIKKRFIYREYK